MKGPERECTEGRSRVGYPLVPQEKLERRVPLLFESLDSFAVFLLLVKATEGAVSRQGGRRGERVFRLPTALFRMAQRFHVAPAIFAAEFRIIARFDLHVLIPSRETEYARNMVVDGGCGLRKTAPKLFFSRDTLVAASPPRTGF